MQNALSLALVFIYSNTKLITNKNFMRPEKILWLFPVTFFILLDELFQLLEMQSPGSYISALMRTSQPVLALKFLLRNSGIQ